MKKRTRIEPGPLAPLVSGLRWQQVRRLKLRAKTDPEGAWREWLLLASRWRPGMRVRLARVERSGEGRG